MGYITSWEIIRFPTSSGSSPETPTVEHGWKNSPERHLEDIIAKRLNHLEWLPMVQNGSSTALPENRTPNLTPVVPISMPVSYYCMYVLLLLKKKT